MTFVSCIIALLVVGCIPPGGSDAVHDQWPSADETIFKPIRDRIDKLQRSKAPPEEWRKYADSETAIESQADLTREMSRLRITDEERQSISEDYLAADHVILFGFEANYHALVFFDSTGMPLSAKLW